MCIQGTKMYGFSDAINNDTMISELQNNIKDNHSEIIEVYEAMHKKVNYGVRGFLRMPINEKEYDYFEQRLCDLFKEIQDDVKNLEEELKLKKEIDSQSDININNDLEDKLVSMFVVSNMGSSIVSSISYNGKTETNKRD